MSPAPTPPGTWPVELRALAACLAGEKCPALAPEQWETFATLAIERHRVGSLLAATLDDRALPGPVWQQFQQSGTDAALTSLRDKAETLRLVTALEQAGCRPVLLKGWPLAERLYGSASLRHSKDIDLHFTVAEVPAALRCLEGLGYAPLPAHATRGKLAASTAPALIAETNDIALTDRAGHMVELHWRLTHLSSWLKLSDIPDATATHPIDTSGVSVTVASDRACLIYLSVHGQLHMWGRLKWLADIARLVERRSDDDLTGDLALATQLGAGRAVRIAVRLSHLILGTRLPAGWPPATWLERRAIAHFSALIAAPGGEPGQAWARMHYHLSVMAFGEGLQQRLASPRYALWRNLRLWLAGRGLG
ncbi:nucleotidyltransferase family protein [Rhodobacteraceae bacterium NNCM2]|nr:nucleotidyltransferase family protein [Coraliihabitans acroporae]